MQIGRKSLLVLSMVIPFAFVAETSAQGLVPVQNPTNVSRPAKPYYVQGGIVVFLMAAAGYAVCRSSGRV
jgi:hypothetical protein